MIAYLHGFASGPDGTKAQFLGALLAKHRVALQIPDLAPDFTHQTITSQLAIVDALLDRAPGVLIGSSLGGYLAALAAARRPERVRGLVLLAPAFGFAPRWEKRTGAAAMARWRAAGTTPVFHHGLGRDEPLSIALLDDARRWPDEPDPRCPALVIAGRLDDVVPLDVVEHFARARPTERELIVYAVGHQLTEMLDSIWHCTQVFLRRLGEMP